MESFYAGIASALWLGILTSISPCPLATNIAAVSFIGKRLGSSRNILLTGLLYTLGRMFAYVGVAVIVVASLLSIPETARFLQEYINIIIGPLLIIVGLFLLNIFKFNIGSGKLLEKIQSFAGRKGFLGAFLLGFVFALAFCPVSAGLFFGSLIPVCLKYNSSIYLPLVYGAGTALPVIIFSFILAFGAQYVGKMFNKLSAFEYWAQLVTAIVFIGIGLYISYEFIIVQYLS